MYYQSVGGTRRQRRKGREPACPEGDPSPGAQLAVSGGRREEVAPGLAPLGAGQHHGKQLTHLRRVARELLRAERTENEDSPVMERTVGVSPTRPERHNIEESPSILCRCTFSFHIYRSMTI